MVYAHACLLKEQVPDLQLLLSMLMTWILICTLEELRDIATYLKSEFEMKDLGKTWFLGPVLEYWDSGILIHKLTYVHMML